MLQRRPSTHPQRSRTRRDPRTRHDLPTVWAATSTTDIDRKELLRILIDKITVTVVDNSELVDVTIRWAGGHETQADLGQHEWSVTGLAAVLHMPTATVYNWIYRGWITARHTTHDQNWIITADPAELDRLRERRTRPAGYYTRKRWTDPINEPTNPEGPGR